jgi:hypothetical protein
MNTKPKTFRFEIGPYCIRLPTHAEITANVIRPHAPAYETAWTDWIISLKRFQFFVHLDSRLRLSDLKPLIQQQTKTDPDVSTVGIGGLLGVTHGDYGPPRTWIDWWFKRGDVMICLCLQSKAMPFTEPLPEEMAEHSTIINSIQYAPDLLDKSPSFRQEWST